MSKRVEFIDDQSVDIRETFGFASPAEVLKAVKLYTGSHYGSMLWELGSGAADQYTLQCLKYLREAGLAGAKCHTHQLC